MLLLELARGHVVDDRVAEDMIHRRSAGDATTAPADDDGEFALVIDGVRVVQMRGIRSPGPETAVGCLVKTTGCSGTTSLAVASNPLLANSLACSW